MRSDTIVPKHNIILNVGEKFIFTTVWMPIIEFVFQKNSHQSVTGNFFLPVAVFGYYWNNLPLFRRYSVFLPFRSRFFKARFPFWLSHGRIFPLQQDFLRIHCGISSAGTRFRSQKRGTLQTDFLSSDYLPGASTLFFSWILHRNLPLIFPPVFIISLLGNLLAFYYSTSRNLRIALIWYKGFGNVYFELKYVEICIKYSALLDIRCAVC